MADKLIVYTTPNCSACDFAVEDLTKDGVDFEERNVMKDKKFYDEALKYAITVPILVYPDALGRLWSSLRCPQRHIA